MLLHSDYKMRHSDCGSVSCETFMFLALCVCVFSLSCVTAALLCLCRGSVNIERDGRLSKPPTVTWYVWKMDQMIGRVYFHISSPAWELNQVHLLFHSCLLWYCHHFFTSQGVMKCSKWSQCHNQLTNKWICSADVSGYLFLHLSQCNNHV